jgi:hypothetical protein
MHWKLLWIALVVATTPFAARAQVWTPVPADAPADVKAGIQKTDTLFDARDQGDNATQVLSTLRELAAKHPDSYPVQWRLARALFWVAETTADKAQHEKLAEEGWDAGKKAIAANPEGPEGLYFKAICVGEVSHSVGILTALRRGLESEFRDPLLKAEKINPRLDRGGIFRALGRYKYELPWPKRDLDQSVTYLRKALEIYPGDLRARIYLADTLHKRDASGDVDEGKRLLKEVRDAVVGGNPPEERRVKPWALQRAAEYKWDLQ